MEERGVLGAISDKKVYFSSLEENFIAFLRLTMLYGTECWVMKSHKEKKLNNANMRMLLLMSGYTGQNIISNGRNGGKKMW